MYARLSDLRTVAVVFFFSSMTFLEGKGLAVAKKRVEAVRISVPTSPPTEKQCRTKFDTDDCLKYPKTGLCANAAPQLGSLHPRPSHQLRARPNPHAIRLRRRCLALLEYVYSCPFIPHPYIPSPRRLDSPPKLFTANKTFRYLLRFRYRHLPELRKHPSPKSASRTSCAAPRPREGCACGGGRGREESGEHIAYLSMSTYLSSSSGDGFLYPPIIILVG